MRNLFQKIKMQMIFRLARRLPDCKHITPLFSESLDRPVTLREKIVIRLHLYVCDACKSYVENLKFMREVFQEQERQFEEEKINVSLSPEARERIKKALKSVQY
jgi:predicted anti-sigma-YlaC factor YlaD